MLILPKLPNTKTARIPTTHPIRKPLAVAVFSVVRRFAIPVRRVSAKGVSSDAIDKARSLNPPVQYLKMGTRGPMLWNRSNPQISSSRTKAPAQIKFDIRLRPSTLPRLSAPGVLHQSDSLLPPDHAHPPVVSFPNNPPTGPPNSNRALPVPLLRLHIHLPFRRAGQDLQDIPKKPVKQSHQKHCQHLLSIRQRMHDHGPALPPEEPRAVLYLISSICQMILCR